MFKRLIAAAALATAFAAPAAAQKPTELNFGIISTESSQNLKQDWGVLLEDMQKRLGVKVNAFFAPDYGGIIEAQRFNKVQVAWSPNNEILATATTGRSLGVDRQEVYFLGQYGQNFKSMVVEGLGFQPQWAPSGQQLVYSVANAASFTLAAP